MSKTNSGNFFEDFKLNQIIRHATPRTLTHGDAAVYQALYGSRFSLQCSDVTGRAVGYSQAPIDDLLVFHTAFGKSVPDVSLNAVANLGYANGRFMAQVFPGDTITAYSEVIGLKENSSGETGVVYVRTYGENQDGHGVIDYVRWVMVRKRDKASPAPEPTVPQLPARVSPDQLVVPRHFSMNPWNVVRSGSPYFFDDYEVGEKIDHEVGMTVEEAEHMMATRLYQNTARVHFDQYTEGKNRFGRRLVYGGHIISIARSLSFNGLGNAVRLVGINGGQHVAPCFGGDTVFAWTEVLEKAEVDRSDVGALRLRTIATKDLPCADFPGRKEKGHDDGVILDFDYWVLIPKR